MHQLPCGSSPISQQFPAFTARSSLIGLLEDRSNHRKIQLFAHVGDST